MSLDKVYKYYNLTKGVVSSGILEYIIPLDVMNNETLGSVFEADLDR